ncbi:MAG TPA: phosphoenolpyruvate--protein phosphotransferase [Candidatus Cloacimonetes bacterium]|nr:phosphoenolpyruvate--protein phosphotransferase [Candidatus Cloacimonadota bacterium]
MKKLKGIIVSSGIAIGSAKIVDRVKLQIKKKSIQHHEIEDELIKFEKSVEHVVKDIDNLIEDISQTENKEILTTHKMILQDPEFSKSIINLVSKELLSLEQAINDHFTDIVKLFNKMENKYYAERAHDYEDVAYRLLGHILKQKTDNLNKLDENSILIMRNISPSGITRVFEKKIKGLCTEKGSKTSHSSIIARSMNLPTLVGIPGLLDSVQEDQQVIIDGNDGQIIISPDKETLSYYKKKLAMETAEWEKLQEIINLESKTKDGKKITLMSNIEIPVETRQVVNFKSEGIGLFRTEFLFLDREELPSENEQYRIYKNIAEKIAPFPLVIRTIDVGGDKLSKILNIENEANPNLGCRGIRFSLEHHPIFKIQIKAILRANIYGNVKIMFPMISGVGEVIKAKKVIEQCKKELENKNVEFNGNIQIGSMIEIPSAALTSDLISEECDFLSIGTNDLVQYTLAVDRDNDAVESYYDPYHRSVIQLIKMTIDNAHQKGIKVALCGELASEKDFIPILIGLGIDELSVSPGRLLTTKKEILNCESKKCEKSSEGILNKKR